MDSKIIKKIFVLGFVILGLSNGVSQESNDNSVFMDFRNQKVSDIIYSLADICEESVLIDETVTGTSTFHFEDKNFESALNRFAKHCQLYVTKNENVYNVSKVKMEIVDSKISINTEEVLVTPFLTLLSRRSNKTIMFDNLPNSTVTIRVQHVELEDVLNLVLVKLPNFGLERIASGYYISKSASTSNSRRNMDIFNLSKVNDLYSLNLQKASFTAVLESLFKKADKEFSLLTKTSPQLESLYYTEKDFENLLRLILEQANCDYSVKDKVYYIFEIQRKDIVKKLKETKVLELKNISVESVSAILPQELNGTAFVKIDAGRNCVYLTGSEEEISPIERFLKSIDVKVEGKTYRKKELKNLDVKDAVALIPKNLLPSDIVMVPSSNSFVVNIDDETDVELTRFLNVIDNNNSSHAVRLKYIKSEDLLKKLPPSINKNQITETLDNSLVFFSGSEEVFEIFKKEMELIDVPKQQIKYQILVIQRQKTKGLNFSSNLGEAKTSEGYSAKHAFTLANIFNINFDIISRFGYQFAGTLNAELSEGKSRVLADTTLNGISGETITFSNTNTYRYRDIIVDTSGDLYTSTTREISSGLTLSINGWVSGDDMVTVKVDAQVSKQGTTETASTDTTTNPPSTSEKKVSTNVRTKSGESVVIGGLFQQETDVTEKRVPILGAIPFIGNLFKSKSTSVADTEFIIYLVPFVEKEEVQEVSDFERYYRKYVKQGER